MNGVDGTHANNRFRRGLLSSYFRSNIRTSLLPMHPAEFSKTVAFITGAGAGIGRSIAHEWARCGGIGLLSDIDEEQVNRVADEVKAMGASAEAIKVDVRSLDDIRRGLSRAVALGGGLDVVFNVAGINIPKNVEHIEEEEWDAVVDTNLKSIYRTSKIAIPEMRQRGGGVIVNVASIAGIMAENRCGAYSASKGGVVMLTRNMAMDFAKDNIRVNVICPGATRTPRTEGYWKKSPTGKSEMAEMCPMKRAAEPEEIARPAVFLASSGASYITGAALVVDGGMTAGFRIPTFDRI